VFDGHRCTERAFVLCTLFVCRHPGQLNPFIVTKPRGMVDDMPCTNAGEPRAYGVPSLPTLMLTNKGAKERVRGRHPLFFVYVPSITKLGEAESASSIRGFCVRCISTMRIDIRALLTRCEGREVVR
jgi:hypothetical protein